MRKKSILAGILIACMLLTELPVHTMPVKAADRYFPQDETQIRFPGVANRKVSEFNPSFFSVTGFAGKSVNLDNRVQYIGSDAYRRVTSEEEFLKALEDARRGSVKVIEIAADMELGWNSLSDEAKKMTSMIREYGWEARVDVITNPSILEKGVSQLELSDIHGLTIFSCAGNTIKHAEWKLQGSCSDIIIRNLNFDEMWMMNDESDGDNFATGWTLLKLNGVKGVWIDHCSFSIAYDGNMDSENGASDMTTSWCSYCLPAETDPDHNGMIYKTFTYMEERYKMGLEEGTVYGKIREEAKGDLGKIMAYEAYHKGFNMNGSGEKDFKDSVGNEDGNQRLHLTMAYNKVSNIIQRFPLVRQGTVNIINCCLDNSGHKAAAEALGRTVTTTAASARAGASVGMDTCVFDGVDRIVEGNERNLRDGNNKEWGDVFVNARNHTLIVNSKIKGAGENGGDYVGSSWDNGGDNPFIGDAAAYWNDGKSTLGSFAWFSHIENVDQYVREQLPDAPFTFTYDEKLPYDYQVLPLEEVEDTVGKYAGAYVLNEEPEFWLSTEYSADSTIKTAEEKGVYIPAEDLKLDIGAEGMALYVDEMKQITADIVPSHAADRVIQWISSDPEVLEIKDSGLAIARKEGKATVTASIERKDGRTVSKAVTVSVLVPLVNELIIENAPKTIYLGDENTPAERIQLKVKALPENAGNKEVTWTSSNPDVLQVDENGVLTPVKAGSGVRITCTSLGNPEVSVSARISVRAGANPNPSQTPSEEPSEAPSLAPSEKPSEAPSQAPSEEPSEAPSQAPSEEPSEAPTRQPAVLGDLDGDGRAASEDALMILQYVVKLRKLTAGQLDAADMNGDGETTADDALLVLQKAVRLISEVFPAGK